MRKLGKETTAPDKRPFDIDQAISHIREAVRPFPKAALFELAEEGFRSPLNSLSPASFLSALSTK